MAIRKLAWLGSRLLGYPGRRPRPVDAPDGALLEAEEAPAELAFHGTRVRRFLYASEGLPVAGWEVRPPGDPGPLPLLLYGRGGLGPHGCVEEEDLELLGELVARGGFLALATEYRGNAGGEGDDRAGPEEARDLATLVEVARQLPGADPSRVVALGFSRGGTMVLMAERQGLRLDAAATIGGVTDLARAFREGSLLLRGAIRVSTGGRPRRHPEAYALRSPLAWAEELAAPLLLLHGDEDETIGLDHSLEMAARLAALGRPHELEVFPGGNHKLLTHKARRAEALLAWYARWLGPPPA